MGVGDPVGKGVQVGASVVKNGSIEGVALGLKVGVVLGGPMVRLAVILGVAVEVWEDVAVGALVSVRVAEGCAVEVALGVLVSDGVNVSVGLGVLVLVGV